MNCGDDDFYGQLYAERIIQSILLLLNRVQAIRNNKEELVGEAAMTLTMILQCSGAVKFDESVNDFIFPANFHNNDLSFEEVLQRIEDRHPDLIDHLLNNLTNILRSKNAAKLPAAHRMTFLLRLLVELEQQLSSASPSSFSSTPHLPLTPTASGAPASPAGSNKLTRDGPGIRLTSPSFVKVFAGLLEMEQSVIEFCSTVI